MSQTALVNLGINYDWEAGEDGWKDGMDLNLLMLDAFGQAVVVSQVNADPWVSSSSPSPGKMYIVGTSPTGATAPWDTASAATIANKLAIATGNNAGVNRWHMVTPKDGWSFYNKTTKKRLSFRGTHGSGGRWVAGEVELPNVASGTVISDQLSTPPGSPTAGQAYLVKATGTGAWASHDDHYAQYNGTAWEFIAPIAGDKVRLDSTGEYLVWSGTAWVPELQFLSANSRLYKIVNCGVDSTGPFNTDQAAPEYTLTREEASASTLILFGCSRLGSINFTNTAAGAIAGNGTIGSFSFAEGAPDETWTLVCTSGGATATFSVTGSVSGAQAAATVGTPYDNGIVSFELADGSVDFSSSGNADQVEFDVQTLPITYSSDDNDVIPALVGVATSFAGADRVKFVAGTGERTVLSSDGSVLLQADPSADLAADLLSSIVSSATPAKVNTQVITQSSNYTLKSNCAGALVVMDTTGGNLTLTVPDTDATPTLNGAVVRVLHIGSNTLTIAGGAGVTITGSTSGTQNKILTLIRSGSSKTWYCG